MTPSTSKAERTLSATTQTVIGRRRSRSRSTSPDGPSPRGGRAPGPGARLAIAAAAALGCADSSEVAPPGGSPGAGVARVEVVWRDTGGVPRSRAFGTAFRIDSEADLLTAHHVAASARAQRERLGPQTRARIHVAFEPAALASPGDADGPASVEVAIVAEDPDADLALLRIVEAPAATGAERSPGDAALARAPRLALGRPPAESAIAVVGYPIGEPTLVVRTGRLIDPEALRADGAASSPMLQRIGRLARDGLVLLAHVETRLGNSGAPIYLADSGEIIGLCSAILLRDGIARDELIPIPHPPEEPITLIVAAERIQDFLAAHRAPRP